MNGEFYMLEDILDGGAPARVRRSGVFVSGGARGQTPEFGARVLKKEGGLALEAGAPLEPPLKKGETLEVEATGPDGVYRFAAVCAGGGAGGVETFLIDLASPVQKIDRRRHLRYPCGGKFSYSILKDAQAESLMKKNLAKDAGQIISSLKFSRERLSNIGGGGLKFISKRSFEAGSRLLCALDIDGKEEKDALLTLGEVVYSRSAPGERKKSEVGLRYIGIAEEQRLKIVEFAFLLERRDAAER